MVTPAEIDIDIIKLRLSIRKCYSSVKRYQKAIEEKRDEQEELRELVDNPGEYDVEALKRNVEMCDQHIGQFEATIEKERETVKKYEHIIRVLEDKKCRLERTLP